MKNTKREIIVEVSGGLVQNITNIPDDIIIIVKDYDNYDEENECSTEIYKKEESI